MFHLISPILRSNFIPNPSLNNLNYDPTVSKSYIVFAPPNFIPAFLEQFTKDRSNPHDDSICMHKLFSNAIRARTQDPTIKNSCNSTPIDRIRVSLNWFLSFTGISKKLNNSNMKWGIIYVSLYLIKKLTNMLLIV